MFSLYNPSLGYIRLQVKYFEWFGFFRPSATASSKFYKFHVMYYFLNIVIIFLEILSVGLNSLYFFDDPHRSPFPIYLFFLSIFQFIFFLSMNIYKKTFGAVVETTVNNYFDEFVKSKQERPRIIRHTKFIQRLFYGNLVLYICTIYFLLARELDTTHDERPLALPIDFFMKNYIHLYGYYILLTLSIIIVLWIVIFSHGVIMFNFAILV